MEIPSSNELRVKNKIVQDRAKVGNKEVAAKEDGKSVTTSKFNGSEQISFSSKAREMQTAHAVIQSTPDIRVDMVNEIKSSLADGTYQVKSGNIADKMMNEVLTEAAFIA